MMNFRDNNLFYLKIERACYDLRKFSFLVLEILTTERCFFLLTRKMFFIDIVFYKNKFHVSVFDSTDDMCFSI